MGTETHDPGWDGEDRRDPVLNIAQQAAELAAQKVARIHRRRLVRHTFIAAVIAATLISLPVALLVNHQRAQDSTDNARYNCALVAGISDVLHDFIASDADLRHRQQHYAHRAQVLAAFSKILTPKVLRELQARSDRLDTDKQTYWRDSLLPRLVALAKVNCDAVITAAGPRGTVAPR